MSVMLGLLGGYQMPLSLPSNLFVLGAIDVFNSKGREVK